MKVLFLIPARAGSKGLPGKNLALLAGIPLVGRAARTARRVAGAFPGSRVVCSTDDPAIAAAAREWGAEVPFVRPAELATDSASALDVVRHALENLGDPVDAVVLLQPTSPLTEPEDVREALALYRNTGSPVVSVSEAEHPIDWYHRMDDAGRLVPVLRLPDSIQRQQLEPSYRTNGAVYVASPTQLIGGGFLTPDTRGYRMPAARSVDVDARTDLEIARSALAARPIAPVEIAGRRVGPSHPCLVVAEAGVNHNGSLQLALQLIDAAAEAGADAVKFQSFRADEVISADARQAEYQKVNTGKAESQLEMARRLELSPGDHQRLVKHCRSKGIMFLSSPFDRRSADLLTELNVPAYKVGSGELTNHPFLAYLAAKGRPLIISTGMATVREVDEALAVVGGAAPVALLHCVSNYPTDPADCNLAAMATLRQAFGTPVGWSDHTLGIHIAVAAAGLGASIIEKHLTLSRSLPGPDHRASIEAWEFRDMVRQVRAVEAAVGTGEKRRRPAEQDTAAVARRSVFAATDLLPGHRLRADDVRALRPGTGIPPNRLDAFIGRALKRSVAAGSMLVEGDFE
jgi:N,N'-diacetyllegionaminate synthase